MCIRCVLPVAIEKIVIAWYSVTMSVTYKPKKKKRKKTHGFLKRSRTPGGRNVIKRRRRKGRKSLTV